MCMWADLETHDTAHSFSQGVLWADLETHDTAHSFSQGVCGQILRHMTLLITLVKVYVGRS